MNKLIILIVFFLNLGAYELQEDYLFDNRIIYSHDLFPELPQKFELLRIPDEITHYRINAQIISKSFELHGISIDPNTVRYVNFTQKSPVDLTPLQKQITLALTAHYPTITIDHVIIVPHGYLKSLPRGVQAVFDPKFFQNSKGTFYITDDQGIRHYLDYSVTATINVLYTSQNVNRKDSLNDVNTQIKQIVFGKFKDNPLIALPPAAHRFRSTIKENTVVTERDAELVPLVLQGEKVTVVIRSEGISVEFEATATQEGGLYDMITIQKNDGKRAKVKVIGEHRVELL